MPAVDAIGELAFKSAFKLAHCHTTMKNGYTTTCVMVSPMNYLYAPIDYLYHKWNKTAYDKPRQERGSAPRNWFMMR